MSEHPSAEPTPPQDLPPEPSPEAPADVPDAPDDERDPLSERAEQIAELPLAERPAAFDGLNRAVVAELQSLEEA